MEKSNPKGARLPLSSALSTVILAGLLVGLLVGGYATWKYFDGVAIDKFDALVAQLAAHQVPHDEQGRLDLSRNFPGLTPRNLAYVTYRNDGTFLAMFPTYYGEGAELAGLLYTSRPLQDSDTRLRAGAMNFAERVIGVGTYNNLLLEKQINPSWYHVSYKLR